VRVLHIIEPGSPGGGGCTLRMLAGGLARLRDMRPDVLILGTTAHVALAKRCGLGPIGCFTPPRAWPTLGSTALRRLIAMREQSGGTYDVIHAWTPRAAILAILAAPRRRRIFTPTVGPVDRTEIRILARLLRRFRTPVLASSAGVMNEFLNVTEPLRTRWISRPALLPPGVHAASHLLGQRDAVRGRWNIEADAFVIGLLSEPANWSDAMWGAAVASRLALAGRNVRLLIYHSAQHRREAEQWCRSVDFPELVIADGLAAEPWRMVRGLDAAICTGSAPGGVRTSTGVGPLLLAMAAGVPVIAERTDAVCDCIEGDRSALLIDGPDINAACRHLMRLADDPSLARSLTEAASRTVEQKFTLDGWRRRLRETYAV
jgi:hypothetical protein